MEFLIDGYSLKDVEDKKEVVNNIINHVGHEYFEPSNISRAMAVVKEGTLCGYFLTCSYLGVRSFHGFKFITGSLPTQFKMARQYIDMEDLKYSGYRTREAKAVLKMLGFKDLYSLNGITVAKRE